MVAIDPAAVLAVAGTVEQSAARVAALDAATPFVDAGEALAGSATTQACVWVSSRLGAALQCWAEGLDSTAAAARATARDAMLTDCSVSDGFVPLQGALR